MPVAGKAATSEGDEAVITRAGWQRRLSRRRLLESTGVAAGMLALGGRTAQATARPSSTVPRVQTDAARRVVEYRLEAAPMEIDLGGRRVATWGYNGILPGPELRVTAGETLRVRVRNGLPEGTSVHWHGLPIANAMDGVPGVTQPPIAPGAEFAYEFEVPVAGTYMYHSHSGLQLDRGVYGPLIVDPVAEPLAYDREIVLTLDDWLDGIDGTPDETFGRLQTGGGEMAGMDMGGTDDMAGMDGMVPASPAADAPPPQLPPDIVYPLYLINGRPPEAPAEFAVRRGERVRLRVVNPSAATIFRVALAGHRLTVTHADGQPVEPVEVDVLRVGMGERYDVLVEAGNPGVWQLAAQAEGTDRLARAIVRYDGSTGAPPAPETLPRDVDGRLLTYDMLQSEPREPVAVGGEPDLVVPLALAGDEATYVWTINDQVFAEADRIAVGRDRRIRFEMENRSAMPHPMHLHGHFFRVDNGTGRGPLKDTVLVEPNQRLAVDWVADNPGPWAFHCHHAYHQEGGMMRVVTVE